MFQHSRLITDIHIRYKTNKLSGIKIKNSCSKCVNNCAKKEAKEWNKIFVICINDKGLQQNKTKNTKQNKAEGHIMHQKNGKKTKWAFAEDIQMTINIKKM